jgi:membrane-associated protease RseP (regulator of RpoE activity)
VVATSKSTAASATVEIVPGKTTKVVLRGRRYGWITGTVSDAATKEPIPGVLCYCYSANDERAKPVTDSSGAFLCPQMPAGPARVNCSLGGATGTVEIIENQEARLALFAKVAPKPPPRLYAGLGLDVQERRLRVRAVVKNTSAAKAGIVVGDVIVAVDENSVENWGIEQLMSFIEERPPGVVKLKIDRGDTEITVPLTLEPRR